MPAPMTYFAYLNAIIDRGINAAKMDYINTDDITKARLEGSLEGFEMCRKKDPRQILRMLSETRIEQMKLYGSDDDKGYWSLTCKAAELEWVLNVLGAGLDTELGVPITARGVMTAAEILGVRGAA